jgi:hypothetical protein
MSLILWWKGSSKNMVVMHNLTVLSAELNPTCHLLALLGAHHILHVSRIKISGSIVH